MKTLRMRVLVAMLLVATMASIVTASLVRRQTLHAVETAASVDLQQEQRVLNEIRLLGQITRSWDRLEELVMRLGERTGLRIAVTDLRGRVLADTDAAAKLPDHERAFIDPLSDTESFIVVPDSIAETLNTDVYERFRVCVLSAGVRPELLDVGTTATASAAEEQDINICAQREFASDLGPPPPVLLYLGYSADRLIDFRSLDVSSLLLALAGVIAASGVLAFLVASRVSRPMRALTAAVTQLGRGDRAQRVDAPGAGEVGDLARAFNAMADDVATSEAARARMVTDVAHELRNPIGVLQGNLEAAQDGLFPIDRNLIDTLHAETTHLSRLVQDLQQLALVDAGALVINRTPTDLRELVDHVVASHQSRAAERNIAIEVTAESVVVEVDPTRLHQVVTNLMANALAYTPADGRVSVRVQQDGTDAVIAVRDTGVGMTADELGHAFERFWRADKSRNRRTGGTGVGLAICHELVVAHGGTLDATSTPGEGSEFRIRIPLA